MLCCCSIHDNHSLPSPVAKDRQTHLDPPLGGTQCLVDMQGSRELKAASFEFAVETPSDNGYTLPPDPLLEKYTSQPISCNLVLEAPRHNHPASDVPKNL